MMRASRGLFLSAATLICTAVFVQAQTSTNPVGGTPRPERVLTPEQKATLAKSTEERDFELKMQGITDMRPTVQATDPSRADFASYDEAKANPYPSLPAVLTMNDGSKVTTAAQWKKRRAEIQKVFDQEIYGEVPKNVPKVTWSVTGSESRTLYNVPVTVKHAVGHVDNSSYPAIKVELVADVITPAAASGHKVPVILMSGRLPPAGTPPQPSPGQGSGPSAQEQILGRGWGYVVFDTGALQADNGAGLREGIIGLVNKGQPRKLHDWGVLRALSWGDSRVIDYLETDHDVNAKKIGLFGASRGGKQALVAMAYEPRLAVGYIASSGAGGANLYRRNFGETVPNILAPNEFHWFAPAFLKYGAVGHSPDELKVDSHELIAMVAPRPLFITGGRLIMDPGKVPGDGWVDARGMFMAEAAAGPVYTLLGAKDLGITEQPPMLTYIGTGDLGYKQHDQGHTAMPTWPDFLTFAAKYFDKA